LRPAARSFRPAEAAEVRMGRVERLPRRLPARRKRARNRFISVLIATIERFRVGEERSDADCLGAAS
jgi:hypothetical protein